MTVDPGFVFYLGNQLRYTAYANGYLDNTMYDSPTVNTTYTFNLAPLNTDVIPTVTTSPVTNITQTSATTGGTVTSDGGATVTSRGVCWSTTSNPTIADPHTLNGGGTGTFVSQISALSPSTLYYVRAYATNSVGTAYGMELNFTTLPESLPSVTTNPIIYIASTSATGGGNVTSDGGAYVTTRGVCWSTSSNPTTADAHTIDGGGTGTFVSLITNLTPNTTYHVRAYATNYIGTAYGGDIGFYNIASINTCGYHKRSNIYRSNRCNVRWECHFRWRSHCHGKGSLLEYNYKSNYRWPPHHRWRRDRNICKQHHRSYPEYPLLCQIICNKQCGNRLWE